MKEVQDLINELLAHPDCIHLEVYTKDDVIDRLSDQFCGELHVSFDRIDLKSTDLTDDEWEGIADQIQNWHDGAHDMSREGPWEVSEDADEELHTRLTREIKLKLLLNEEAS